MHQIPFPLGLRPRTPGWLTDGLGERCKVASPVAVFKGLLLKGGMEWDCETGRGWKGREEEEGKGRKKGWGRGRPRAPQRFNPAVVSM